MAHAGKELGAGLTLPIYALTAEDNPAKLHEYVAAGCNHCLTKPIDVPEMQRVIKENVGGQA